MRIRLRQASRRGRTWYIPIPIPVCQQTISVTVRGPLTIGVRSSPSSTSSHQRGSLPRGTSRAYWASISASSDSDHCCGFERDLLLALARFRALGPHHVAQLRREERPAIHPEDVRGPLVYGAAGELRCLVLGADECVPSPDSGTRCEWRPPLPTARRVEGVDAAQRVALHEVTVLGRDLDDLILADERVAAHQRRWGDRALPSRRCRVVRIAPERVVVAVALRDVAERVRVDP